jgi:glutamate/aspartate transport system permease protein
MDVSNIIPALPNLWQGLLLTLKLLGLAVTGGLIIGTLLAVARMSANRVISGLAGFYVNYFRSIPLLLVITWFYFMVPFIIGWATGKVQPVGAFTSALIAFTLFEAAYYCEIVRAGIQSVTRGQVHAAYALGLTYRQSMRLIILPQAFRRMAPLLLQQSIILFQDTSLVYAIGLMDFLNSARSSGDIVGQLQEFLLFAGLIYFAISFVASYFVKRLQARYAIG